MASISARCHALWSSPDYGATAVEYGLMALMIAAMIVGVVTLFGTNVNGLFDVAVNSFP